MSSLSLPGFEVLDTLRQTSKTITVKAVQRSLDRTVALASLRPELAANPSEVHRFLEIARICSQIKADGLPQIYDITSHGDQPYMVMEYVEGLSIAEIVRQNGPMPVALSIRVALTIADALNHAWKQNRLVHRNLKPSEIRIDERGTPKLTDFGRATVILPDGRPSDEEDPGVIVGTPNFLSPEQVLGTANIDCRADIYALGATLYYMITGRVPFPDYDPETVFQKQLTDQIPHPRAFRPDLAASISGVIIRLMMKVPTDRYADWTEAMGDMQLALKNQPLRRRDTPPKGISTVSAVATLAESTPAPELPQLRKIDSRATETPASRPAVMRMTAAPAVQDFPVPRKSYDNGFLMFIRITLWVLLCVWFVLLGNNRLNNPLELPSFLLPLDTWFATAPAGKTHAPPPAVAVHNTPIAPPPVAPVPVVVTPAPVTNKPVVSEIITPPPVKPVEPDKKAQALPPENLRRLADALARGDLAGARATLAADIPMDPAKLAAYRNAVAAIPDPMSLAEQTIKASKGQEMTINYMGKERRITPRNVANGEVEADFTSADGIRPVTLKLAKLTPDELLKLLPAHPEGPATHAAVCLALLKANRKAEVTPHVVFCGVLGPVFEAAAQP